MTKISGILLGELSANSIQKSSRSFSGWSLLLPRIIAALTAPNRSPCCDIYSDLFLYKCLKCPTYNGSQRTASCITRTFSIYFKVDLEVLGPVSLKVSVSFSRMASFMFCGIIMYEYFYHICSKVVKSLSSILNSCESRYGLVQFALMIQFMVTHIINNR